MMFSTALIGRALTCCGRRKLVSWSALVNDDPGGKCYLKINISAQHKTLFCFDVCFDSSLPHFLHS